MSQFWLNILGSGGFVILLTVLGKAWDNRQGLRASKPKADADTESVNLESQRGVIQTLTTENARQADRVIAAEASARESAADAAQARADVVAMEKRMTELDRKFEDNLIETRRFRDRVEDLLIDNHITIPDWWHDVQKGTQ